MHLMDKDYKNRVVFDIRWARLRWYQRNVLTLRYAELEEEVKRLCGALGLPDVCAQNAVELAKQFVGRGYSPQALAAAALILVCRRLKMPRPLSDFANYVVSVEKIRRTLRELAAAVKTPPQLEHYVAVIASRLNVPPWLPRLR
jgi:Transcription initiation factor TFIIIB, Brf1 subunit/Transcription initiation factor TFIIB